MVHVRAVIAGLCSLAIATAQRTPKIVPTDLQSGFESNTQIQVSYTDNAVNGFLDGTLFEKDAVSQEPTFALGDSSGISPTILYTILMLDTTCPQTRTLHYARANFKNNNKITNINSSSPPLLAYQPPGAFGETGDNRQYSFLMYTNPGRREIETLVLPGEGEPFDVGRFQEENGLEDASAGVGMVVKLGGQANCGEGQAPNTLPASLAAPRPGPSSTLVGAGTGVERSSAVETGSSGGPSTLPPGDVTAPTPSGNATNAVQSGAGGPSAITSTADLANVDPGATRSPTSSPGLANAGLRILAQSTWVLVPFLVLTL